MWAFWPSHQTPSRMLPNTFFRPGQHVALPPTAPVAPYQYPSKWMSGGAGHFQTHENQILGQAIKTTLTATPSSNSPFIMAVHPSQPGAPTMISQGVNTSPKNKLVLCDCQAVPIPQGLTPYPTPPPPPPPKKKKKKNLCPLASKRYCSKQGCPLGFPQLPQPVIPDCAKTGTGQREHFIVTLLPEDKERFDVPSSDWLKTLPYPMYPCVTDRMVQWEETQDGKEDKKNGSGKGKNKKGKGKK